MPTWTRCSSGWAVPSSPGILPAASTTRGERPESLPRTRSAPREKQGAPRRYDAELRQSREAWKALAAGRKQGRAEPGRILEALGLVHSGRQSVEEAAERIGADPEVLRQVAAHFKPPARSDPPPPPLPPKKEPLQLPNYGCGSM